MCWQLGWRELQSPGVLWLPDGHGSNLQSFHSPGWVKTSSNPVPTGNGLYSTSAFSASAKSLASILRSRLWSLFQKREGKKGGADLGQRGSKRIAQNKMERFDVSTLTAARLSSLYVTGCCGMNHAASLWMLCKQFIVTVQVWVTIPVKESPQTYCSLKGFIIAMLFREVFRL